MKMITAQQVKRIHTLKTNAGLDDVNYRLILQSRFNKHSSKDLTEAQASVLISILLKINNKDLATEKQVKRFNAIFKKLFKDRDKKQWIFEHLKVKKTVKQLDKKECSKLIFMLEQIEKWQKGDNDDK